MRGYTMYIYDGVKNIRRSSKERGHVIFPESYLGSKTIINVLDSREVPPCLHPLVRLFPGNHSVVSFCEDDIMPYL
jgi:hypothetical protein